MKLTLAALAATLALGSAAHAADTLTLACSTPDGHPSVTWTITGTTAAIDAPDFPKRQFPVETTPNAFKITAGSNVTTIDRLTGSIFSGTTWIGTCSPAAPKF
jgi:hypothetical protein